MKLSKKTLLISILIVALSACSLFEPKDKGLKELKAVEQKWQDGLQLAGATSRIALSTPVSNLQSIKRELVGVEVGKCLQKAKTELDEHMELMIQAFVEFMSKDESSSNWNMEKGMEKLKTYRISRDSCIK